VSDVLTTVESDLRHPGVRLSMLLDPGTIVPLHGPAEGTVLAVEGRINGVQVIAYCTDATAKGGAIGAADCDTIVNAIDIATRERCPVIGLWHSAGARLGEEVDALDGIGSMFSAMVSASGLVPQISVVLGPAAGGAAYGPALTDLVIMAPGARVFVTGPEVVRSVTGEQIDMEGLGGPRAHAQRSGVVHVSVSSEQDAYDSARALTTLLSRPGRLDPPLAADGPDLAALLPATSRRAYDVRPLVRALLDPGPEGFREIQAGWAPSVVVGLGRMGGHTVGVVANNPLRKGGCLDSLSAEKAARFVRMFDSFGVPLVVLVDVPGYLPGVRQEWEGVVRRGAKLLYAFAEATVPRVTLITRKAYGGAYIAMNSRALGATAVFAWPQAEVAIMGAEAAVDILHRKVLSATPQPRRDAVRAALIAERNAARDGVRRALAIGAIDEIIEPRETRHRLTSALAAASRTAVRGARQGNIPL
jgi:acetyl-CoA/propionyl-CoA carboxylase carboxyl transferase subunit